MPKLLISYRRSDSDAMAGRIRDNLAAYYGNDSIFIDVDNIPFGTDFREHIRKAFADQDLLIAVVGQKWLGARRGGRSRIQDETDPVRVEVEMAIEQNLPILPVLVSGARMPKPDELPERLKPFSFRNAAEVDSGRDFRQHMDRLIRSIDEMLGLKARRAGQGSRRGVAWPVLLAIGAGVFAVLAGLAFVGRDWLTHDASPGPPEAATLTGDTVVEFGSIAVGKDPIAARPYLNQYGLSVDHMVPPQSEIVLVNNRGLYEGGGVMPSTSQIFLTQTNTGNVVASYTLNFSKPVAHMSFTRPALYAATESGVTHPAWKATALGANGEELAAQSETLLRHFKDPNNPKNDLVPARVVTFESVTLQGISAVRFDSDPRLDGKPFAAFSTLLIERLSFGGALGPLPGK